MCIHLKKHIINANVEETILLIQITIEYAPIRCQQYKPIREQLHRHRQGNIKLSLFPNHLRTTSLYAVTNREMLMIQCFVLMCCVLFRF